MNSKRLSIVPLQQASLCLDCDMITAAHTHCFVCGSAALLNLARTLNDERDDVVPLSAALAAAASHSAGRAFATEAAAAVNPQRSGRFIADLAFPYMPEEVNDTDARGAYRRQSLRGISAVVHRAITVALIGGLLVLASTTPASGHSPEGTKASSKQIQCY
jgi:hypothetical protein